MTIHAREGPRVRRGRRRRPRAPGRDSCRDLLVDDRARRAAAGRLGDDERQRAGLRRRSRPTPDRAQAEEERRILHVAMTRAEERLILSGVGRLGDDWPAPSVTAPPLAGWAARLGPELPHVLGPTCPRLDVDRPTPAGGCASARRSTHPRPPRTRSASRRRCSSSCWAPATWQAPAGRRCHRPRSSRPRRRPAPAPSPAAQVRVGTVSFTTLARYAECPYRSTSARPAAARPGSPLAWRPGTPPRAPRTLRPPAGPPDPRLGRPPLLEDGLPPARGRSRPSRPSSAPR